MRTRSFLLCLAAAAAACAHAPAAPKPAAPPPQIEITARDADAAVRAGTAVLLDVREKKEVADGMAAPAMWFPLSAAEAGDGAGARALDRFAAGLPKDRTVVLYCHSGRRAAKFAVHLKERGYKTANMGGFADWKAAGLPVRVPAP
ncbi:MAG: rhodanese-like domain-containing protein [Elusimicrobia bacterium]|nr:rhodanese-like domain-containing protein [Elusimicrobiota bacterium]